ncbi:hypothetical protein SO802_015671 [Lithocarpus litseifolius]|uniref:Uncharacterized protein n=1 Tax=Lithocarpus litseifolius TaxID=425828 RepID=A0AAW2CUC7_9ROSI
MATGLFAAAPLFSRCDLSRIQATSLDVSNTTKDVVETMIDNSSVCRQNLMLMIELRKKILTFRDIIDLPPCECSSSIYELLMGTIEDLHNLYPNVVPCNLNSEMKGTSINQGLAQFYNALRCIGDSWEKNHKWITNAGDETEDSLEDISLEQLGRLVQAKLNSMTNIAKKMFDVMEEDEDNNERLQESTIGDGLHKSYSQNRIYCPSPDTPTSISPEMTYAIKLGNFANVSSSRPLLLPLRLQAVGSLMSTDMKSLSFKMSPSVSAQGSSPIEGKNKAAIDHNSEMKEVVEESPERVSHERPNNSKETNTLQDISNIMPKARKSIAVPPPTPPSTPHYNARPTFPSPPASPSVNPSAIPPPPPNIMPKARSAAVPPPTPPSTPHYNAPPTFPSPPASPSVNPSAIPPPPPPPIPPSKGSVPMPPPPMPLTKGAAAPPPPPPSVIKALRPKKATTKLKRSTHMGNMYRVLKGKVEGSSLKDKLTRGSKTQVGGSAGGQKGMADALAEMTKRSAYFQQIEEDVQKHAKAIVEVKIALNSFQTKDMAELIKFHKYVEQHLEKLTDETQVLARFEGFPMKKLESLRIAAALYIKLEGIVTTLQNWKIKSPLNQLLDKVESYFNKIKGEVDALERTKDEESKRLQSHNIHFDFNILVQIKESMVDVSSSCIELALKERRVANSTAKAENISKTEDQAKAHLKMLWRVFQLAFRVYSFAGGQDDRADMLTQELAKEIEADPQQE